MRTRKLRQVDVKQHLPALFEQFDLWFPKHSSRQESLWARIERRQLRDQAVHFVAVDDTAGDKVVGIITYNREWSIRRGGAWIVTITEFLVQPEYDNPRVRASLLHEVIRAAIACQAVAVQYHARLGEVDFFKSELWHCPTDRVLMERHLPWERFEKLPKTAQRKDPDE